MIVAVFFIGMANAAFADSALREIRRSRGALLGRELAILAIVAWPVCLVISLLPSPYSCILPEPSPNTRAANSLKQIGLGFHDFHQVYGHFPGPAIYSAAGKPLLSWRVAILPLVEGEELYNQFHLDEPWDSPHNLSLLAAMPAVYGDGNCDRSNGLTRFQAYVGPGSAFEKPSGAVLADFFEGGKKTLLVTEGEQWVPWTKPTDLPFERGAELVRPHVRHLQNGTGFWALSADGACHAMPADTPEETLRALITRNGGEKVEWP
jgi:hypothetical protein